MTTYKKAIDTWEESRLTLGNVETQTAKKSASKARKLNEFIGKQEIDDISPCDIEQGFAILKRDEGLSNTTLRKIHLHGSQACKYAISHGMAKTNPFELVDKPRNSTKQARTLTNEQANQLALFARQELEQAITENRPRHAAYTISVMLALSTGMRRGEIMALEWKDYDGSAINVARAVKDGGGIGHPKTSSGVRRVSIGSQIASDLDAFKEWQSGIVPQRKWDEPAPMLCDKYGKRCAPSSFDHWWAKFREKAGFYGLKFHELRHTHASLLIGGGVDVKTVQGRLGHSSADITMNTYAHILPRNDANAAKEIDSVLFARKKVDE